ncbi:MAG: DUF4040 domain-containing protein, partial [Synergistaceae bacterium]|nr:DUF4040 domain-containing protein [Synergistaceae bacterium]
GCGSREAVIAAVFHMVNHSIFKGSLFLVAGMVDHSTGTRDMRLLRGLSKAMPVTSALAFCGAFAMAGVYPFNGFLSKEMLYENSLLAARGSLAILGPFAWLFPVLAVVGCIFTFLDCMMIVFRFFYGGPLTDKSPRPPHEPAKMMLIPSAILASGTILAALFANPLAEALLIPAADAVTGTSGEFHISYWHGFNTPFIMTAITTAAGVYLYLKLDRIHDLFHRTPVILSGNKIYDWLISDNALANGANRVTNSYMTGRLQNYVRFTCVSFILAVAAVLGFKGAFVLNFSDLAPVGVHEITWLTAMAAATGIVVKSKKRAVSVLSLGLVGYGVAFLFVLFSAPDLALTQLVVETVSIVLFFLAFRYLPPDCEEKEGEKAPSPDKAVNLAISIAMGAAVTTIALVGHGSKMFDTISNFYIENSRLLGGGSNVVNVLLVDFRALDTMGEISVISVAAIGVFALISLTVGGDAKSQPAASARRKMQGSGVVINTVLRPLTFFILMFSFYLLWNGHNAPGGGFIAGLMTAAGIVLLYVNHGSDFIRKNLPFDFKYLVGLGLACSMSCGLGALLFGYPFLTQTFGRVHFPHLGEIELATALIFDLGVYLVVTGGCLTIITGIGQSGEPKEEAL